MIRLRPSGVDEILIKRVQDWYEPGPGVFITSTSTSTLFSPAMLFTGTTTGAWYDPSDITTLFQNAAGTIPVTAVEQPVGRMLDKSGRGNHAFNGSGNSANFPVLSARYNLLTKTEQFDDAYWKAVPGTVTRTAGFTAPDGTNTAWQLVFNVSNQEINSGSGSIPANQLNGLWIKGTAGETIALGANATTTLTLTGAWQYVSAVSTLTYFWIGTWSGSTARTVYVWHPQVVPADQASLPYQRVNTATDYDTVGFKPYLRFNGTNQWLQTNSIDFTNTAQMFVSMGIRRLADTTQILAELSSNPNNFYKTFSASVRPINVSSYGYGSSGTALDFCQSSAYTAPLTHILSGVSSISTPSVELRVNGAQVAQSTTTQGTGNYGNYPLYMGARAGTSLWANIRFYGAVVAGKQASAAEITNTETFINQKTGAY